MINPAICLARSAFYAAYEPARLRWERRRNWLAYAPELQPNGACRYDNPLVTVYVPTYNRVALLVGRCLPSVVRQTYRNIEIIVANHGSTDTTDKLWFSDVDCDRSVGHPRMRIINVPRVRRYPPTAENHWLVGPVDPANAALKAARGAWVARCDDDDEWTPDHVEALLRFAQEGNYEFVSSAYSVHGEGEPFHFRTVGADRGIGGTQTWLYRSYLRFMRYNPDCWRKRTDRVNDLDLADRMRRAGVRIGFTSKATAIIRPRPGESFVGSRAYKADPKKTEAFYKF